MTPPTDLLEVVRATDRAADVFRTGEPVVVAVSGGPDSVALLHVLARYAPERRLRLHVAHLDHQLRPTARADAVFVAGLARRLGLGASVAARDVIAAATELGRGLEHAARVVRYRYLAEVAAALGAEVVAVGHTADDQAETVLMNVLRGAGLDGLRGMRPVGAWPVLDAAAGRLAAMDAARSAAPRLVRPLLAVWRADARAYLDRHGLPWRQDPTNREHGALRNRVRDCLLPALEAENPRFRQALVRLSASVADDLALVEAGLDAEWRRRRVPVDGLRVALRVDDWPRVPRALQRRLVRAAVARLAGGESDLGWEHVEAVRSLVGRVCAGGQATEDPARAGTGAGAGDQRRVDLPGGLVAMVGGGLLEIGPRPDSPTAARTPWPPAAIPLGARVDLPGGWAIEARVEPPPAPETAASDRDPWSAAVDADRVDATRRGLRARGRLPGDRMAPLGLGGRTRKLQDIFVDGRVPRWQRASWPVVVSERGVVWLPGYRIAHEARVRPDTGRVLLLRARPPAGVAPMDASRDAGPPASS